MADNRIRARGLIQSLPSGSKNIDTADFVNLDPPYQSTQIILGTGDNVIPVPNYAKAALIIFDPTSTILKILKGDTNDVGIRLQPNSWNFITIDQDTLLIGSEGEEVTYLGTTSLIITTAEDEDGTDGLTEITFF